MSHPASPDDLLGSSILVTGSHYSMTTLVGRVLAASPHFHLLHEPANARPTLSYDSITPAHWYEFYDDNRYEEISSFLKSAIAGEGLVGQFAGRVLRIRSFEHAFQTMRYAQRKLPMKLTPKPVIIKDPFLLFSAPTLQKRAGLRVILTIRHPCAFAESFMRAGKAFDFTNLMQPALVKALPEEGEILAQLAANAAKPIEQAAHLWRIIYRFAANYLIENPRSLVVKQGDLVRETRATLDRLFAFVDVPVSRKVERFVDTNLGATGTDFAQSGSYIQRDSNTVLNKWQQRLQPSEIATIRRHTSEIAAKFGYAPDDWLTNPSQY